MRTVFMGTPDFAVPSLRRLLEDPNIEVVGVVTQPDRPKGRGNKMTPSPVKQVALEYGVEVFQPVSVNTTDAVERLALWSPQVIAVVAFGQILKPQVLELPAFGCINLHASLLPKYRGAAPIHWALINGETKTGVTTMYMDKGLDTGDIILQEELSIGVEETTGEVHDKLADLGGALLVRTLHLLSQGKAPRCPQEDSEATYAPVLTREHEEIHWDRDAVRIVNHIRGMNPWPGTFTTWGDRIVKLWRAQPWDAEIAVQGDSVPVTGQVVKTGNEGIIVQTGKGQLAVTELQLQNRCRMRAEEFLRGHSITVGEILGGAAPHGGQ